LAGGSGTVRSRLDAPLKRGGLSYNQTRNIVAAHNHSGQSDDLVMAFAYRESRFDPQAKNPNPNMTAAGMMELTKNALKDVQARYIGYDDIDKFDPEQNIDAAPRYLSLRSGQIWKSKSGRYAPIGK
jgi:soluble lytic murein transglycosylase-like protein